MVTHRDLSKTGGFELAIGDLLSKETFQFYPGSMNEVYILCYHHAASILCYHRAASF
jgi:hypothetical protein